MQKNDSFTRTLTLSFNLPIYPRQINNWRGAFIEMAGWEDEYFHNHANDEGADKYHYRYPLIQYRIRQGKAAIFAINEGVTALQEILAKCDWKIRWEGEIRTLQIEDLRMNEHYFRMLKEPKNYRVNRWVALNQENFEKYQNIKSFAKRLVMLEKLLTNHLMAGLWGMGFEPTEKVETNIIEISNIKTVSVHGQGLLSFTVDFSANVLLPPQMAIGKSVSHGFGWIAPERVFHREKEMPPQTKKILENK